MVATDFELTEKINLEFDSIKLADTLNCLSVRLTTINKRVRLKKLNNEHDSIKIVKIGQR